MNKMSISFFSTIQNACNHVTHHTFDAIGPSFMKIYHISANKITCNQICLYKTVKALIIVKNSKIFELMSVFFLEFNNLHIMFFDILSKNIFKNISF